ncbi:MAG: hypothetical protein KZQ83_15225 [gamma proteobacterium symbiont of Taylorina sp.]|nr:hypothetical protein [gamma proteobacterium symbiont of Taylorina sp.]
MDLLDGEGFPIKSHVFDGNISEASTLKSMIDHLIEIDMPERPVVVMDAGISSKTRASICTPVYHPAGLSSGTHVKQKGIHFVIVGGKIM